AHVENTGETAIRDGQSHLRLARHVAQVAHRSRVAEPAAEFLQPNADAAAFPAADEPQTGPVLGRTQSAVVGGERFQSARALRIFAEPGCEPRADFRRDLAMRGNGSVADVSDHFFFVLIRALDELENRARVRRAEK